MTRLSGVGGLVLAMAVSQVPVAQAQDPSGSVRLVEFDDGMASWVYAYVRAETEPVLDIDERGISFDRDPSLLFACVAGEIAVVYKFDTELMGENSAVRIQFRFEGQSPSQRQMWSLNHDPRLAAEIEVGAAALGADSANPLLQMFSGMSDAARMPAEFTGDFLQAAHTANQVTLRVTDPMDGETHTDVFPLLGFSDAIERVTQRCRQ